jgi:hypothetical protein
MPVGVGAGLKRRLKPEDGLESRRQRAYETRPPSWPRENCQSEETSGCVVHVKLSPRMGSCHCDRRRPRRQADPFQVPTDGPRVGDGCHDFHLSPTPITYAHVKLEHPSQQYRPGQSVPALPGGISLSLPKASVSSFAAFGTGTICAGAVALGASTPCFPGFQ